ncbi:FUSC family protein [Trinickia violacea]|nr:FUSC family protein [Trinickia violacea]
MTENMTRTTTDAKQTRREVRTQAGDLLFALLKSLPFRDRLAEGLLMALQAMGGACMAYGIGLAVHPEQAFWAAITAIAVTQHTYADTRNLSRDQFIGAMAGGLFGFAGAWLGAGTHEILGYATTIGAVILVCWCVNVGSAARLGAITATIVLLVPQQGPLWDVALYRLGEVTLGTLSALFVSLLVSRLQRVLAGTRIG